MSNACIMKKQLTVATLAALVSGCSSWNAAPVMVEERRVPVVVRAGTAASKAGVTKVTYGQKPAASAQSYCGGEGSNLIHPAHFDSGQCPLLHWQIRKSETLVETAKASPRKSRNRDAARPRREESAAATEPAGLPGNRAIADVMSGDEILEMKPARHTPGPSR
jgi:hypothetical protein